MMKNIYNFSKAFVLLFFLTPITSVSLAADSGQLTFTEHIENNEVHDLGDLVSENAKTSPPMSVWGLIGHLLNPYNATDVSSYMSRLAVALILLLVVLTVYAVIISLIVAVEAALFAGILATAGAAVTVNFWAMTAGLGLLAMFHYAMAHVNIVSMGRSATVSEIVDQKGFYTEEPTAQDNSTNARDFIYPIQIEQIEKEFPTVSNVEQISFANTDEVKQFGNFPTAQNEEVVMPQLIQNNIEATELIDKIEESTTLEEVTELIEAAILEGSLKEAVTIINSLKIENPDLADEEVVEGEIKVAAQMEEIQENAITHKMTLMNPIEVSVYPNPTLGEITIKIDGVEEAAQIEVYSSVGQVVFSQTTSEKQVKLDLRNYDAGIYFIRINNGENSKTARIVKK